MRPCLISAKLTLDVNNIRFPTPDLNNRTTAAIVCIMTLTEQLDHLDLTDNIASLSHTRKLDALM